MIAITGSTGQLGRLVIDRLLTSTLANEIVALARDPQKAADIAARGVQVRRADYDDRASLDSALAGVDRLLLISSSEIGKRAAQHANVVGAARDAGVKLLAYTSLLHADSSPLNLADEHRQSEAAIKRSGIPYIFLRNGWYTENYSALIPIALANGVLYGCAGDGRISGAARVDYAEAAAKVIGSAEGPGRTYELAGDTGFTLTDFAAEISRASGRDIPYRNVPEEEYRMILIKAGMPDWLAAAIASWDSCVAQGALFDDGLQLRKRIGRPTTPMARTVVASLAPAHA